MKRTKRLYFELDGYDKDSDIEIQSITAMVAEIKRQLVKAKEEGCTSFLVNLDCGKSSCEGYED